ncbi:unnamed protein product, partial [Amoebophrya sp. A25]|eukprot:GSA25T00013801001.1
MPHNRDRVTCTDSLADGAFSGNTIRRSRDAAATLSCKVRDLTILDVCNTFIVPSFRQAKAAYQAVRDRIR